MADDGKIEIAEDTSELSFEAALAELETIVERLERGDVALEASIEIYQRGSQLRAYCDEKLRDAQMRIEKIHAQHPLTGVGQTRVRLSKAVATRSLCANYLDGFLPCHGRGAYMRPCATQFRRRRVRLYVWQCENFRRTEPAAIAWQADDVFIAR